MKKIKPFLGLDQQKELFDKKLEKAFKVFDVNDIGSEDIEATKLKLQYMKYKRDKSRCFCNGFRQFHCVDEDSFVRVGECRFYDSLRTYGGDRNDCEMWVSAEEAEIE